MDDEFKGEFREFKRVVIDDLKELKQDIKILHGARWKIAGMGAVLVIILTIGSQIVGVLFSK